MRPPWVLEFTLVPVFPNLYISTLYRGSYFLPEGVGQPETPSFPGPDRTELKLVWDRGTFLRIFSGQVREFNFGLARVELLIDPDNILTVLIHNLQTAWRTKISMPFLSSLDNLL